MKTKVSPKNEKMSILQVFKRLLADMKKIRGLLIAMVLVNCACVGISLATPYVIGTLTDYLYELWEYGTPINAEDYKIKCIILASVYILSAILSIVSTIIGCNATSRHFTYGLRVGISAKISRLPVGYIDKTPTGEILSRMMDDVSNMSTPIYDITYTLIDGIIKLVGISIIIFATDYLVALVIISVIPISVFISAKLSKRSEDWYNSSREINGKIYSITEETFTGFNTVKAFGLETDRENRHDKLLANYTKQRNRADFLAGTVTPIITFTNAVAYLLICIIGGYMAINGTLSVGSVVLLVLYAKMFAGPLDSIAMGFSQIQNTVASSRRVYQTMDETEMPKDKNTGETPKDLSVEFKNVNFSYEKDKPVIKNLSFKAKQGQKVAIVGATGAGKTTIVNLLMRFYDISSGSITLGGVNIYDMPKEKLREYFSMVLQDTWLFSGTVYENVALGKKNASKQEIERACEKAHIDGFIKSLKLGYNTVINEESTNISGGQKQLLTIARAYLSDRDILILDEATSNVDTRTEMLIQQTMDELMQNKTSFVIAHRLSTIVNADVILVVENGDVVEQGTHKQLLEKGGVYSKIYLSQYSLISNQKS